MDVNILGGLPSIVFTFVVGILGLKFLELLFWDRTWKSFFDAIRTALKDEDDEESKTGRKTRRKRQEPKVKDTEFEAESLTESLIRKGGAYIGNDFLMSPTERDVYKVLERAYGDKYYIFAQVRVVDVLRPNMKKYHTWTKEYKALFRQVSQWHFDYVMCDKEDFRIYCALELDDPSHERPDRQRRDRILNAVCLDGGVDLKRMQLNHAEKKVMIMEAI